jgi:hypothetical protein
VLKQFVVPKQEQVPARLSYLFLRSILTLLHRSLLILYRSLLKLLILSYLCQVSVAWSARLSYSFIRSVLTLVHRSLLLCSIRSLLGFRIQSLGWTV